MVAERKGKYALVGPEGSNGWWYINDMELDYAVVSVQASYPGAEAVIRSAWDVLPQKSEEGES